MLRKEIDLLDYRILHRGKRLSQIETKKVDRLCASNTAILRISEADHD